MALMLIDADSIYFRAAMVNQKQKEIRTIINRTMKEIESQFPFADQGMRVAVKGRGNFRKDIYPAYKAHRPELNETIKAALTYGHNYMVEEYNAVMADGMEADDLVCIWAYEARELEIPYAVVGIDKDLLQIPGNHYNFVRKEHQFIDDDTADLKLMLQCLTGDNSDNIPGIKGIGPKKAEKILDGIPMARRWSRVRAAWRGHGTGDPALSWRLLSMLKSWEEFDEVRAQVSSEASVSEQDVRTQGKDDVQDSGVSAVSE